MYQANNIEMDLLASGCQAPITYIVSTAAGSTETEIKCSWFIGAVIHTDSVKILLHMVNGERREPFLDPLINDG